jgi:hypothetical protein
LEVSFLSITDVILGGAGLLYRAFAIGKLALVSPIASAFAAVTALLATQPVSRWQA